MVIRNITKNKVCKLRVCLLVFLNILFCGNLLAQKQPLFLEKMEKAFVNQDTSGLGVVLSGNFAIAGQSGEVAKFMLNQIIKNFPVKTIQILKEKKHQKGQNYQLEIKTKDGDVIVTEALANTEGKIIHVHHFDFLYGLEREDTSRLVAEIPFENHLGSIILEVYINDYKKPLRLLFDTGADGMAVSKELADDINLKVTRENNASVVGGNQTIQVSDNNSIRLDTLTMQNMGIAIFPTMTRDNTDGIIGNSLLRRFITHIDYDKNILSLYTFGPHNYKGEGEAVEVGMPKGVIELPGNLEIVEGKAYNGKFIFDTGASYDLICFRPFVRENRLLVSGFKPELQAATVSMGISSPTFLGPSFRFSIPPLKGMKGLPVTLMGGTSSNEGWNPGADGSIGVRLLSRYNMTINIAENEVFFTPNKLHSLPQDFVINEYQFGWTNDGRLVVLSTKGAEDSSKLIPGDAIKSINGMSNNQIIEEPSVLKEIKEAKEIELTLSNGKEIKI